MKKLFICTLLLIITISCATKASSEDTTIEFYGSTPDWYQFKCLFDDFNSYKGSVALGISGPYSDKEEAIQAATDACLQMLAFNQGLAMEAKYSTITNTAQRANTFSSLVYGGTIDEYYTVAAASFEIVDVKWYGGKIGAAVFARLPGMTSLIYNTNWIEEIPNIKGWNTAVASSSDTYSNFSSAIEAATFRAAEALLNVDDTTINVDNTIEKATDTSYRKDAFSISGNKLQEFRVIAYQYDRESKKVYALVISRDAKEVK